MTQLTFYQSGDSSVVITEKSQFSYRDSVGDTHKGIHMKYAWLVSVKCCRDKSIRKEKDEAKVVMLACMETTFETRLY